MTASTIPPLSVWPCGTPFGNTQKGPDRHRSAPITDPLSRGFGIQPDPLTSWYNGRAGVIPFRYSPDLPGGKGTSHVGWDTGDLPSQGKKIRASNFTWPMRSPRRNASSSLCRVPNCPSQKSTCASLNVAAGYSRRCSLRVSDAGGSRRSYSNGVLLRLHRAPPSPRADTWLEPVIQHT
jgi:hypothetical protein